MNHYFLGSKIPTLHQDQLDLIERMESASGAELSFIKEGLTNLAGEKLAQLSGALLDKAKNGCVLSLIVESVTKQHGLSVYERADILKSVCQHYNNDLIDGLQFESLFSSVIDTAGSRLDQILYYVKTALLDSFSHFAAKEKLVSRPVDFIDRILARALNRYPASLDIYLVSTDLTTMIGFIGLPQTLRCFYSAIDIRGDEDLKRLILADVFKKDALTKEYIDVLTSVMDVDVICKICAEENLNILPAKSVSDFIDFFGEGSLFPETSIQYLSSCLADGYFHPQLYVLENPDLIINKMPSLANFMIDNAELIYNLFVNEEFDDARCGLLKIFSEHNRLEEVMPHDIKHLRTLGWLALGQCTLAYTLEELKDNDSPRYWDAIRGIGAVGLVKAEPFLRGIRQSTLKDVIEHIDISNIDKKMLVQLYPSSRGLFLEHALGL